MSKSPPYVSRPWQFSLLTLMAVMLVAGVIFGLIGSVVERQRREKLWRTNLRRIALAIHNYHDTYRCFPRACVADKDGRPTHSWRMLVLQFVNDPQAKQLYQQYDFTQPWDSPKNLAVANHMPAVYRNPFRRDSKPTTSYMVISGPGTVFEPGRPTCIADIRDGTSNTIMVVEVVNSNTLWTEPKDLNFSTIPLSINASQNGACISSAHPDGAFVVMVDGFAGLLRNDLPPDVLRWLIERDDGISVPEGPK
ncbi:MAG: DUF1559 domain-containing protein [Planctomycetes bacterium]|nr:DUF1559 domain-containing protein [Planctomycetota bacterium]MBL7042267.1 DUF1559 domain-containing protein [Pirellulaceae bacterium]